MQTHLLVLFVLSVFSCKTIFTSGEDGLNSPKQVKQTRTIRSDFLVIAHRGASAVAPENTMSAFKAALPSADAIEFDIQLSKDNVPIINHDYTFNPKRCRKVGQAPIPAGIAIRNLTAAETQQYDCGIPPVKDPPPRFDTVLAWRENMVPAVGMFIELKGGYTSADLLPPVISALGNSRHATIISFHANFLQDLHEMVPDLALGFLTDHDASFCPATQAIGAQIALPQYKLVTASELEVCRNMAMPVYTWTVNGESDWERLSQLGVDGFITDDPSRLDFYLRTK